MLNRQDFVYESFVNLKSNNHSKKRAKINIKTLVRFKKAVRLIKLFEYLIKSTKNLSLFG
jgi:hypothetical protein